MREPLSITIITKNEEKRIAKCLDSVSFADEILVVDSGSTDRTVEIARQYGARVIQQSWLGYGRQKRFAVDQARNDWVLCLDADEWLSEDLQESIKAIEHDCAAYSFNRRNKFLGKWLRHGEGYPDRVIRLFNRRTSNWTKDIVHERVRVNGKLGHLYGDLMHESEMTLASYKSKQNDYAKIQAKGLSQKPFYALVIFMVFSPLVRFLKYYLLRAGFMDGLAGFAHAYISARTVFLKNFYAFYR